MHEHPCINEGPVWEDLIGETCPLDSALVLEDSVMNRLIAKAAMKRWRRSQLQQAMQELAELRHMAYVSAVMN